jgi:hypothetical protein
VFRVDEPAQQVADRTADWVDGAHLAAEPGNDAGHVDATAPRITAHRRTAELVRRQHPRNIRADVDGGIHG